MKIEVLNIDDLIPYENNAKEHPKEQIEQIKKSIIEFNNNDPIAIDENNVIIEGHGRHEALKQLGYEQVECIRLSHLNEEQKKAYRLIHNKLTMNSDYDFNLLEQELMNIQDIDMLEFDFDMSFLNEDEEEIKEEASKKLTDEFLIPPISVFDTRQGYWQDRKRAWKSLGISSDVGRDEALLGQGLKQLAEKQGSKTLTGTSIFDPVLCEVMYKWFNVHEGSIFDCFAGGSVRGIVAEKLGYKYTGIDLRKEQIEANILNAQEMGLNPTWICDDSLNADLYVEDDSVDLLFSCPPYADLEVYSDDERDISNMDYEQFKEVYRKIIDISCRKVKNDRFAIFVVGDVRDKKGYYRNFIDYTKECFNKNGFMTYNEIILLEQLGTIPLRARYVFKKRKVAKAHQNILIFYKGDINNIPCNYSNIEVGELDTQ
nr:MAG TPA: Putative modification methylase [Caudoviricetes sp.]